MARILAIDYGTKRTGLAVTDPEQIIAVELATVSTRELIVWLKTYLGREEVECIVVGEPKQMDNSPSQVAAQVQQFVNQLERTFPDVPVKRIDERLTSKMAFQSMIDSGVKKKDRRDKSRVDRISATLILQNYMANRHFNKNNADS